MSNGVFNFNFLALVLFEILGGPKFTLGGPTPLDAPSGQIFVPKASTSQYLIVFLISTLQLLYFPKYQGVPNLHQGALCPLDAPNEEFFCTQSDYFTIYNCVFNFNILAVGGPGPPVPPQRRNFCILGEYFIMSNGIFNFNYIAFLLSEILGSPKFTLGRPTPPGRPLAEKFLYPKRVLHNI